eukprot:206014_1
MSTSGEVGTGIIITIMYGTCQLVLLFILSIRIYYISRKSNDKASIQKFAYSVWKQRGIYSPVIIHIYDTATDIGVLYEWYNLAQFEKTERNLESLDMQQFFWTGIGFMIAYRVVIGFFGAILRTVETDSSDLTNCQTLMASILGFFLGLLELNIFVCIHADYKESIFFEKPYDRAGTAQKISQLMEGVLESLPEVVMQSVFLMRALNDPKLKEVAGDIEGLVIFSIIASVMSITNKYVWIDEFMVWHNAKSIYMTEKTKDDALKCFNNRAHVMIEAKVTPLKPCSTCDVVLEDETILECADNCYSYMCFQCRDSIASHRDEFIIPLCRKSAYLSYGYIVRVAWRFCAVLSRFVIFSLIWVVLGGAFEMIIVPIMMIAWYIMVCGVASYGNVNMKRVKERVLFCSTDDCFQVLATCCLALAIPLLIIITGFVFQMGILGIAGRTLYFIRVIENILLMCLISIFAFMEFDCDYCAASKKRSALENDRILAWIVVGWVSVSIHCVLSLIMPKFISEFYRYDIHNIAQDFYKTKQKRQTKSANDKEQTEAQIATSNTALS